MNYNDRKWHGWTGGECPVHPKSEVSVMFDGGIRVDGRDADEWDWKELNSTNIVAFRVTKVAEEPREFWILLPSGISFTDEDSAREWARNVKIATIVRVREVKE